MRLQDTTLLREEIRQLLLRLSSFNVRSIGQYGDTYYNNTYALGDLLILHEFEAPDLTDATDTFTLDKPLLILYFIEREIESGSVDTRHIQVEFQLAVNFQPDGFITLLNYMELLRVIVNPRDKRYWLELGLAPRQIQIGSIINGAEIKESLKDRLLIQSLTCQFTYIGAN